MLSNLTVTEDEMGMRLDRWFKAHYPALGHGPLQKLLRTGPVRVDGKRIKTSFRVEPGMEIRVPPMAVEAAEVARKMGPRKPMPQKMDDAKVQELRDRVIYKDKEIIVFNKPAGLAVQGGTGTRVHLDGMLDALQFEAPERPRLVHRLDKDTSGVLVLARSRVAARALTAAFRDRTTRKIYWAVTVGCPSPTKGKISLKLAKGGTRGDEKMRADPETGQNAVTLYAVLDEARPRLALVALMPLTGRTHQLRAHMLALGTPILGDGKYGGYDAFIDGIDLDKKLHLHARSLEIPKPSGGILKVEAPLSPHMEKTMAALNFTVSVADPFPRD